MQACPHASTLRFLLCLKAFWLKHCEKLYMPSLCSFWFCLRLCTQGFVCALKLTGPSVIGRRREPGSLKSPVLITYWSNLADNSLKSGGQQGMPVKQNERARGCAKERERDWERERERERERQRVQKVHSDSHLWLSLNVYDWSRACVPCRAHCQLSLTIVANHKHSFTFSQLVKSKCALHF